MNKQSIDDLRSRYARLTGKEPAIRWNRQTLEKKITEHQVLAAHYAAKDKVTQPAEPAAENPEFERLANQVEITGTKKNDGVYEKTSSTQAGPLDEEEQPASAGRGGPREGAGRPAGQTDERARVERIMALDVPDLAAALAVDGLNGGLARLTGVGLDDKPVASSVLANLPHGSESMALGVTRLLYYWFPSLQGRTDVVTLHLEALFLILNPLRERAERQHQIIEQKKKEQQHGKEEQQPQAPAAAVQQPGPPAKDRAKAVRRKQRK